MGSVSNLPSSLPLSLEEFPKLTREQAGHIRHFHNLATLPKNNWSHMWSEDYSQESMDAYRYQLANLAYSVGLAHYHRLPAMRSVFKPILRQTIDKMLLRDVWGYWFNTSQGGKKLNPSLVKPREPWADPVIRENIMYSGHLVLMTSLYAMLFDDDEFEKDGSIVFDWDPQFWGEQEAFSYSTQKLQQVIISEMEKNSWLGVCCEPNVVFVVCNLFPLIAIRYNDVRHGTNVFDTIIERYKAAWLKKGLAGPSGHITDMWMVAQDQIVRSDVATSSAWSGSMMNTWNSDFVYSLFDKQRVGFITDIDGHARIQTIPVGVAIRKLHEQDPEKYNPDSASTLATAKALVEKENPELDLPVKTAPTYGFIAQWLSELGKDHYLAGVIEHADEALQPTWENGGLYYQRNNTYNLTEQTYIDPITSNTSIGYSRLNVKDGQKKMFEAPWTSDILAKRPYVDNVDLSQGVDFLRGEWSQAQAALVLTLKAWDGKEHLIEPKINNLPSGTWGIYISGQLQTLQTIGPKNPSLSVAIKVLGEEEVDLVVLSAEHSNTA